MLTRILVGINGTESSSAAMEVAIALATRHGASLVGLGIVDVPHLTAPESVPLGAGAFKQERDATIVQTAHAEMDEILAAFNKRCQAAGVNPASEKRIGDPAKVLSLQAQRCDLLVVGKRHLPVEDWEQSSRTLNQLLRQTPRPVLCVPAARFNGTPALVAYDGSLQAARTLQSFVESGLGADRQIYVASLGKQAREHAELATEFLTAHRLSPQILIEESANQPSRRLLEICQQIQAGLIVLGCYGQPRLKEFLFGSVTKGILAETTSPLFLYH